MNKNYADFYEDMNNFNKSLIGENNVLDGSDLDFCQFILPENIGRVSVVGNYIQYGTKDHVAYRLNETGNGCKKLNKNDEYYFGASPKLDGQQMDLLTKEYRKLNNSANAISKEELIKKKSKLINKYVKDNCKFFCLPYRPNKTDQNGDTIERKQIYNYLPAVSRYVTICVLKAYDEIYSSNSNNVFYSGVLMKMCGIKGNRVLKGNLEVSPLELSFTRSSYAMVHAFDLDKTSYFDEFYEKNEANNYKKDIQTLFEIQDNAMKDMNNSLINLYKTNKDSSINRHKLIEIVNEYLEDSIFVNQIGVTSSVETSDGYFIISERPNTTYDKGKFYPAVNGNGEIEDENVEFYKYSLINDYPTVKINSNHIDFYDEVKREAGDELDIDFDYSIKNIYGLTITGMLPIDNTTSKNTEEIIDELRKRNKINHKGKQFRRCHFSILFENKSSNTYEEICKKSKNSVESFEINKIFGIRLPYRHTFYKSFLAFIGFIKENIIPICAVLILGTETLRRYKESGDDPFSFLYFDITNILISIENLITVVVALTIICKFISVILKHFYSKRTITRFFKKPSRLLNKTISSFSNMRIVNTSIRTIYKKDNNQSNIIIRIISAFKTFFLYYYHLICHYAKYKKHPTNNSKDIWNFNNKPIQTHEYHPVAYSVLCCYIVNTYRKYMNKK